MNCYYHNEKISSAICQSCGKSLCAECASLVKPPICKECIYEYAENIKVVMVKYISISLALGVGCSLLMKDVSGFLMCFIPFGWTMLNKITYNMFLIFPFIGWFIYFIIKLILSFVIGWIALPIKLYEWILILKRARNILEKNSWR